MPSHVRARSQARRLLLSSACFTLATCQVGGLMRQKSLRDVSWEGCRELPPPPRGKTGPGRITLALTQEIWGRGWPGEFEMY